MSHFSVKEEGTSPSGKTKLFIVRSNGGAVLGEIKWFGAWRKYCFYPQIATVFDYTCLQDLAIVCMEKTAHHRKGEENESRNEI